MLIYRHRFELLATTCLSAWWWLSLLIVPNHNSIIAVAAAELSSDPLQYVRSHQQQQQRRRRRAQQQEDGIVNDNEDNTTTTTTTTTTTIDVEIVGGDVVPPSSYPFYAYVFTGNATAAGSLCGGTLIHPDIVLTAAQCASVYAVGRKVYIGGNTVYLEVEKTFAHPAYVATTFKNDIMLVKLKGTSAAKPVRLNRFRHFSFPYRRVSVIGYGRTKADDTGTYTTELRRASIQILIKPYCVQNWADFDNRFFLCAGVPYGGKNFCDGDDGSPLLAGTNVQHGIASFYLTGKCGGSNSYLRVSRYFQWIWYYACQMTAIKSGQCASFL